MNSERIFAIPDIHGQLDQLVMVLDKMRQDGMDLKKDQLVFLGDMIDRGKDSAGVIKLIRDLQKTHGPNVVALLGNHEVFMIDSIAEMYMRSGEKRDLWEWNGGVQTLRSYGHDLLAMTEDVRWMKDLPIWFEYEVSPTEKYFFSHAAAVKETYRTIYDRDQPFTRAEMTWGPRYTLEDEPNYARDFGNGIVGVSGHNHRIRENLFEPRLYPHAIFLDAGCGCSSFAPLVGCEVRSRTLYYGWPFGHQKTL